MPRSISELMADAVETGILALSGKELRAFPTDSADLSELTELGWPTPFLLPAFAALRSRCFALRLCTQKQCNRHLQEPPRVGP